MDGYQFMKIVVLDFETYYDTDYSLSKISTEQYVRDDRFEVIGVSIKTGPEPAQWFSDPMEVQCKLHSIDWSTSAVLAHNTIFDAAILGWRYSCYPTFYLDTLSMARPHFNLTTGGSLAALAEAYGVGKKGSEVIAAKGKRRCDFTTSELEAYGNYCCNDVELTWRLFQLMRNEHEHEYRLIDQYIRLFVEPLLHLDAQMLAKHLDEVQAYKQASLTMAAYELGIDPDELKRQVVSNDKFAALLQSIGVAPPQKISPTTGLVTWAFNKNDADFITLMEDAETDPDPLLKTLIDARIENKGSLEETRTQALLGVAQRGTLPVYLAHYAAHTGRAGGGDKINLQNLPVREQRWEYPIRKAILAPPGHVCMVGDLSQIEARILAWLAGQQDVVDAFVAYDEKRGPDIYCVTASNIYGREITKADTRERFVGKVVRLALGYGMSYIKFQRVAKQGGTILTQREAYDIVEKHRAVSPMIVSLWRQGDSALHCILEHERGVLGKHGAVVVSGMGLHLPQWGRVIRYPHLKWTDPRVVEGGRREPGYFCYQNRKKWPRIYSAKVIENVVQALAGILVADAWLRLAARNINIVLQVHDELVAVVHKDDVERVEQMMREEMTRVPTWAPGLPISCGIGYAERYGEAKA